MEPQEKHSMKIAKTHPSGAEEWVCPTCGRRILMQWPPEYKKVVLEEGDPNAQHQGSKGGVELNSTQISAGQAPSEAPVEPGIEVDEERLFPYSDFLDNLDIDNQLGDGTEEA